MRTQVILSTQSPSLLDCFEPEDVIVVDREVRGTRRASKMTMIVCNCINYKLEVLHFAMVAGPES